MSKLHTSFQDFMDSRNTPANETVTPLAPNWWDHSADSANLAVKWWESTEGRAEVAEAVSKMKPSDAIAFAVMLGKNRPEQAEKLVAMLRDLGA